MAEEGGEGAGEGSVRDGRGGVRATGEEAQGWRKEWRRDGEVKRVPGDGTGDGTGDGRGAGMAAWAGRWWLLGAFHLPPHLPPGRGEG